MQKSRLINILLWLSRILFGIVFIFSGFVKAIDPLGSVYKFQDYFLAFNSEWLFPTALPLAILLSSLEFVIGVLILLGVKMKYSAWGGLLFMLFFTPLTLYIAIYNPVSDCGCFGDALIISNWSTFYKNVVILAAAILIFIYRNRFRPLWSERNDWIIAGFVSAFILWLSIYCLRNLPIIDFRPWKVGNNINELVVPIPEIADIYLIYRNKETGERQEYAPGDLPWNDPEWMQNWEFVDQRSVVTREFKEAPINNFHIQDEYGDDYTESYIGNPDYQFLVIAYDLNRTKTRVFEMKINNLAEDAMIDDISLVVLTGSSFSNIELFRHQVQAAYPFYQSDEIALKTIIRANPGLLLIKDGIILAKWHWRNIPEYGKVKEFYFKMEQ
jgi:uncharacterized membrane protein YphA (DoxX/SURF4 family)